ncbi:GNAT family N-acetyltransferase [Mycolicibacterium sp. S3B2]|uniref:GNAT family N-acetyltransferase n=1 Tax=Mycolicibacterium sp. S3B2 TaxID=3415120 RepID=UPI003C7AE234
MLLTFRTPGPDSSLFEAARDLGDSQSQFLGLLPYAAWKEYAIDRRILCAVGRLNSDDAESTQRLMGYVAFRLPRQSIALTHLAVNPMVRHRGVAKQLVEELRSRYLNRRGISARCRRDYPAYRAWPSLGFVARGDRKGRSAEGHLLTDWWYDFGHPDLLTWQGGTQTTTPVVIDANIFLSLHNRDADERVVQAIAAVEDRLQILVTPELSNELNRHPDAHERRRLIRLAQQYPQLAVDPSAVNAYEDELVASVRRRPRTIQDRSDARHVAYALAAGIDVVVTEDRKARTRMGQVAKELGGLVITNPFNLVALLDEREGNPSYAPRALKETGYKFGEAKSDGGDLVDFINNAAGERRTSYQAICDELAASRPASNRLVLRDPLDSPVGLIGTRACDSALEVRLLRVRDCALQNSVAAQLVGHLRTIAAEHSAEVVLVRDRLLDSAIYDALLEDGYHAFDAGLVALTFRAAISSQDLRDRLRAMWHRLDPSQVSALAPLNEVAEEPLSSSRSYQLEHQLRPLRLLDADLGTWILPIKPAYAAELFGYPPQLYDRRSDLGMRREHVFFRGKKSGEAEPGRILWYASRPQCAIFAISTLVEVRDVTPEVAERRYQRLGVYSGERLKATAGVSGTVRALRITDTELLDHPVPLSKLRQIERKTGQTLQLWSATKVGANVFAEVLGEAFQK